MDLDLIDLTVDEPGKDSWKSGWHAPKGTHTLDGDMLVDADLDPGVFSRLKSVPVNMRLSLALTLWGPENTTAAPEGGVSMRLPEVGSCTRVGSSTLACVADRDPKALITVSPAAAAGWSWSDSDAYAPFLTRFGASPLWSAVLQTAPDSTGAKFLVRHLIAHIRRDLDFHELVFENLPSL